MFHSRLIIPLFVGCGLLSSGLATLMGAPTIAHQVLLGTLCIGALPLLFEIFQSIRRGHFGVDLIAIVAILTSLFLGQYLAGTVILLMLSGGEALEEFAIKRARKELTELIARAPQHAHLQEGKTIRDVHIDAIRIGDIVVVKPGETIPVDGRVVSGTAMVDESALTGESIPIKKWTGQTVMSGSIATDGLLTIETTTHSSDSTYARIIRLVQEAEQQKAPFVRLADRYSVWFTSATFVVALIAWLVSRDPLRLLAVLVVATPCPLILATPIAFAAGISRAAKRGIIIRNGGALEQLGEARSFVFDKTGTLTLGTPRLERMHVFQQHKEDDVFRIAASLDQFSTHVLARALVQEALRKQVTLLQVDHFTETFGDGVMGTIEGTSYMLGRLSFLKAHGVSITKEHEEMHGKAEKDGHMSVYIAADKHLIGIAVFADIIRDNVPKLFANLRTLNIDTVRMLTGDKRTVALSIATSIGLDASSVHAECLPEDKVREVQLLRKEHGPVVMVGDGVNDAPALAASDVGIAMGAHGDTAASQAGDVVIMVDEIERVGEALCIGHRVLDIAKQSIFIGIGLSLFLMVIAALGYIQPVIGALLQEIIDVVVILNALRVLFVECTLDGSRERA